MFGLVRIAYKLLAADKAKFSALVIGITFAVFLMVEMTSLFAGVLNRASATVTNIGAAVWVMDPAVRNANSAIPLPDYVLDEVRSIPGVRYAVPLYSGGALVKLTDGTFQPVNIYGLDDTSLFGRPELLSGQIRDIFAENGFVVVNDAEYSKLNRPPLGADLQINDHRATIVGIAKVASSGIFGTPTLYTTYTRALEYLPNSRFTMSYVLVQPAHPEDVPAIELAVKSIGYLALTRQQFIDRISTFYKYQTGMGTNLLLMTAISFIVGLSISGQTFYAFILENLEKFGALKAIGAKSRELIVMILFQAGFVSLTGYGLGVGLCAAMIWLARLRLPDYAAMITFGNLGFALVMTFVIAASSSYVGIRRVLRIEPFDIFRG